MKLVALKSLAGSADQTKPLESYYTERNTQKSKMLSERQEMVQSRITLHSTAMLDAVRQIRLSKPPQAKT